ncbi:heparinase II/III family protein [Altericroceibacterium xinjiangense]|uniref:heparinase II/III family protein n=1 Tax=Altericroceibacterium xinjiangense TaxID=762261 RepID=UPI000F7DFCA9|nr:heparinase II/III family protein [Altericroceibacterium xinjiangense]
MTTPAVPLHGIEPEKLALASGNGPAERLIRLAYRAGVPGPAFTPFRKAPKPRLRAVVASPLAGNPDAGAAVRDGHLPVDGQAVSLEVVDFGAPLSPPLAHAVHGFGWLRDLAADPAPVAERARAAEHVLARWLNAHPKPDKSRAWDVGIAGQRLLAWLVHAPLILSGSATVRTRTLAAIGDTARWLDRNVAAAPGGLDEITGWCAIVAAGLLLPGGKPRRLFGEAGLVRALGDFVGEDGGVLSRSPLDQIATIERLVELIACYRAVRRDPPPAMEAMLHLLVPPLLSLLHADSALGNWQGAGALSAARIEALVAASGVRARALINPAPWGYQRVAARAGVLLVDAAPPPLARHAHHGCASTLAFEFSYGDHRLVVNCGGAASAGGAIPPEFEQALRATAAHSTLVLGDANSTAVLPGGKLGAGVDAVELDRRMIEPGGGRLATRIEASHDGYAARYGLIHQRVLTLRDDGRELCGEDGLVPAGRKRRDAAVTVAIRFHLGRGIEPELTDKGAVLPLPDGSRWRFVADSGELSVEESLWTDGEGSVHPVRQLVIGGMAPRDGRCFSWRLAME